MNAPPASEGSICRVPAIEPLATHRVEVLRRRRIFDDFLKIDEGLLRVDGHEQRRLSMERGDAVAAIVRRTDDDVVVLARQFRFPTVEKGSGWLVELAAGVVEDGEDPEESLRREIVEELGYEIDHLELIARCFTSPGGSSELAYVYYAEVSHAGRVSDGGGLAAEGEHIELVEVSLPELRTMVDNGEIEDAKTLIGAMWLLARDAR